MFQNAKSFNQPLDRWAVTSISSMSAMFEGAESFNQALDKWQVTWVKDMSFMFAGSAFNQDISMWEEDQAPTHWWPIV